MWKAFWIRYRLRDRRWIPALTFCASTLLSHLRPLLTDLTCVSDSSLGFLLSIEHSFHFLMDFSCPLILLLQSRSQVLTFNWIHTLYSFSLWNLPCPCMWDTSGLLKSMSSFGSSEHLCQLFLGDVELFATQLNISFH